MKPQPKNHVSRQLRGRDLDETWTVESACKCCQPRRCDAERQGHGDVDWNRDVQNEMKSPVSQRSGHQIKRDLDRWKRLQMLPATTLRRGTTNTAMSNAERWKDGRDGTESWERERERDEKDEKETDLRERRWGPNQPEITSRNAHGNRKSPVQITFTTKL